MKTLFAVNAMNNPKPDNLKLLPAKFLGTEKCSEEIVREISTIHSKLGQVTLTYVRTHARTYARTFEFPGCYSTATNDPNMRKLYDDKKKQHEIER